MAKAVGIGGVFLHFQGDEKEVMKWYETNLGLDMTEYGTGFIAGDQMVLLSFKRGEKPNTPFLNLRVDDIDSLMDSFKQQELEILSEVTEYPYGKFAQFVDPFGNPIELWEVYEKSIRKWFKKKLMTIKNKTNKWFCFYFIVNPSLINNSIT